MNIPLSLTLVTIIAAFNCQTFGQTRRSTTTARPRPAAQRSAEIGQTAVVIDETLSVLRDKPSLYAETVQRMHRGRRIQIVGVTEADGVKFYRVTAPPSNYGWVQADAVFGKFRSGDEERLARLVQASSGFDQVEMAVEFFNMFPDSRFRPSILLLYGDLLEETAAKLTKDAGSRLNRREMAASAAPLHSYYLNYVSLDRYRKLGITFLFNSAAKAFHYNGASWTEILKKYGNSTEAAEAQKRIDSLKSKMDGTTAK
jgi:hypothetical protein